MKPFPPSGWRRSWAKFRFFWFGPIDPFSDWLNQRCPKCGETGIWTPEAPGWENGLRCEPCKVEWAETVMPRRDVRIRQDFA